MTITATTNRIQYTGDGSSTGFAFPFRIFAATDLEVFLAGVLQTTGYSVTGGSPSGTVNFAAAPGAGVAVLIRRAVPATQPMDLVANDPFPAETAEAAFDRNTILAIQMAELIQTCLRLPRSEALVGEMAAAAIRANKYFGFDNSGAPTLITGQPAGPGLTEAYWWGGSAGGTASAHVVTVSSPPSAYADGQRFYYRSPAASTGATTVNFNGLGALPIRKGDGTTALSSGDIPAAGALVGVIVAGGGTIALLSNITPSVDLSTYAGLAVANTFAEPQTIAKAATGDLLTVRSTDAGAGAMGIKLDRNSASPAAADVLGDLQIAGRDDAAAARVFAIIRSILRDPAAATAEGELQIMQLLAGSLTTALSIRNGLLLGAATGGFQGTGTLNAAGFYRDGAALPFQRMAQTGFVSYTHGGTVSLTHGLGAVPTLTLVELRIDTSHSFWTAGDVWELAAGYGGFDTVPNTTSGVKKTSTTVVWNAPSAGIYLGLGGTAGVDATKASVNLKVFA